MIDSRCRGSLRAQRRPDRTGLIDAARIAVVVMMMPMLTLLELKQRECRGAGRRAHCHELAGEQIARHVAERDYRARQHTRQQRLANEALQSNYWPST